MTTCCSLKCKKRYDCAKHCFNKVGTYPSEDYSTFGSGTITPDICTVNYWCGELGNYKMFEPIEKVEEKEEKIPFPFQYLEKYLLGEMTWDAAIDSTLNEANRLIEEYIEKHDIILKR